MNKNTVTGFILIAVILFGFTFIQSRQAREFAEQQRIAMLEQAKLDSIAMEEQRVLDSIARANAPEGADTLASPGAVVPVAEQKPMFRDSSLNAAFNREPGSVTLENGKIRLTLSTLGAQPSSVLIKDYFRHDSTELYLFKEGGNVYDVKLYVGEYIHTKDFNFQLVESSDSSATFRLPFSDGGYIEQRYTLGPESYLVRNRLSFIGMKSIPRNISNVELGYSMTIPRLEKGYKNEMRYSKLDYYQSGEGSPGEVGRGRNDSEQVQTRVEWFAFQQQFFSAIFRAGNEYTSGNFSVAFFEENDPSGNLMTCTASMKADIRPGQDTVLPFEMVFGPSKYADLKSYGRKYEKIIPLGGSLIGWFSKYFIIPMFDFFHRFIDNFGIIILLMTIVLKLVVLPFTYKSYASSAKMAALRPEMEKINERYPKQEDAMKKQQATMDLYKRAGVNPMGGCLPMLLTFPILWAMFRFFPASIELRQQPFLWADDLSTYDSILNFPGGIPLIGNHLSLFALLMAVTMWVYSKVTVNNSSAGNDPNAKGMQFMSVWLMPIMMFFICNNLSSALSYYYLLSQLISMLEVWVIRKFVVNPDAILAKARAGEGKPAKKSKFMQRLEEAQRMQQQQLREQQKKNNRKK